MTHSGNILLGLNFRRIAAFLIDHFISSCLAMIPILVMFNPILDNANYMFSIIPVTICIAFFS